MKGLINTLAEDKLIYRFFLLSILFVVIGLVYVIVFFPSLPPLIPLYNQLPWGPTRLGIRPEIFIPLLVAIGVIVVNIVFYRMIYTKMPLVSRMLGATMLLTTLLTMIFLFRIIQLII